MTDVLSEKDFQRQVTDLLQHRGWRYVHFKTVTVKGKGGFYHATPLEGDKGFVDLVAVKGTRVLWLELKAKRGVLSDDQKAWRDALLAAGQEWFSWKPKDWDTIMETIGG